MQSALIGGGEGEDEDDDVAVHQFQWCPQQQPGQISTYAFLLLTGSGQLCSGGVGSQELTPIADDVNAGGWRSVTSAIKPLRDCHMLVRASPNCYMSTVCECWRT